MSNTELSPEELRKRRKDLSDERAALLKISQGHKDIAQGYSSLASLRERELFELPGSNIPSR